MCVLKNALRVYSLLKSYTWKPGEKEYDNCLLERNDHCVHSHFQDDKSIGLKLFIGIKKRRGRDVGLGLLIFLDLLPSLKGQYHGRYHDFWPKLTKFKL